MINPLRKTRLFTPGPTPLLGEALVEPLLHPMNHRKEEFRALMAEVQEGLRHVFRTDGEMLLLTCSGSGAMEAALTNLLEPGEKALIGVAGKFGERWKELAERFGVDSKVIEVAYGESLNPEDFRRALESEPSIGAVFIQALETSTGAAMDLESFGRLTRDRAGTVLVVDAITGLGSMPIRTDEWGIDVVIGGSQKAFMLPPGLAMLAVSEKAGRRIDSCSRPRYYFDLSKERRSQREGQTAYTPAIAAVQGLRASLRLIRQIGIDQFEANAALQAEVTREAVRAWGMKVVPRVPGNAITVFAPPEGVNSAGVIARMKDRFGALVSGGQGSLKGKVIRIGHLGYFDFLETAGLLACLELALAEAGAGLELGSGVAAAQRRFVSLSAVRNSV